MDPQRQHPVPGVSGEIHGGRVFIEFDAEKAMLVGPDGTQYLPCEDCGLVFAVSDELISFCCDDCRNASELTEEDFVEVLKERGALLISELVPILAERCGSHHFSRRRVRQLFMTAMDRWPKGFTAHRVENDHTDQYIEIHPEAVRD